MHTVDNNVIQREATVCIRRASGVYEESRSWASWRHIYKPFSSNYMRPTEARW